MQTIDQRIAKHGKAWRYVKGLEDELQLHRNRRTVIMVLTATNIVTLIALAWALWR